MLVPLLVLATGAVLAGFVAETGSSATDWSISGRQSISVPSPSIMPCEARPSTCRLWVKLAPLVVARGRHRARPTSSTSPCRRCLGSWPRMFRPVYLLFSTNGTSTSSTTALFVRPAHRARPRPLEDRRRRDHRRGRARTASPRATLQTGPARRTAAERLPLSLCLRHADRRRGPGDLVSVCARRGRAMASWPILSPHHLPAAGRRGRASC